MRINFLLDRTQKINTIILTWVISYLLILIVPLVSNFFIYNYAKNSQMSKQYNFYTGNLSEMSRMTDNMFSQAQLTIDNILQNNPNYSKYLRRLKNPGTTPNDLYTDGFILGTDIQKTLVNTPFKSAYIYFPYNDIVISNSFIDTAEKYYNYAYSSSETGYDEWINLLAKNNYGRVLVTQRGSQRCVELIYKPYASEEVVVLRLSNDFFESAPVKIYDNVNIFVLQDNFTPIYTTDSVNDTDLSKIWDDEQPHIDSDNVYVFYTSEINHWKYAACIPRGIFFNNLTYVRATNLVLIICSVITCCILSVFFSFLNFKPLKKLADICGTIIGKSSDRDIYNVIGTTLSDYINCQKRLYSLQQENVTLKNATYFEALLKNRTPSGSTDVKFISDKFLVILINPINAENLFGDASAPHAEVLNTTHFVFKNILEELFNVNDLCYVPVIDEQICCIINFKNEQRCSAYKLIVDEALIKTREITQKHLNFSFGAYISSPVNTNDIALAYTQTRMLCALSSASDGKTVFYDEFISDTIASLSISDKYRLLFEAVRSQSPVCIQIFDDLNNDIIHSADSSVSGLLYFEILCKLLHYTADDTESINTILQIISTADHDAAYAHICSLLGQIKPSKTENNSANTSLVNSIIEYIRSNYTDCSLSVAGISEHFGFSAYYISKIFKDATEYTIPNYLNHIRIDAAKYLLANTSKTVQQIYTETGFNNKNTFARTFAKYEPLSPVQYRKQQQNKS